MKERMIAAIGLLQGLIDNNQIPIGGQAEVQYKQAMQEIQLAIDAPAPDPEKIIDRVIVTEEVARDIATKINDLFMGVTTRLGNVEAATASLVTDGAWAGLKLEAIAVTLDQVKAQTTPAPAAA